MSGETGVPRRRRWRREVRWFVAACVLWTLYYPLRMDRLYRAIPPDALVGSYSRGLSSEWMKLARHDGLMAMLTNLGVEDAQDWRDDEGIFQTLFWLTGRHTVFGLKARPGDTLSDVVVYGASYVGWKARPMEFLRLIQWIPGLGRLDVTPSGTRYLVFHRSKKMRRLGLVLSLDLYEGVLVGVLSKDPDAARQLGERVRHDFEPAPVFGEGVEPWREPCRANHRLWVSERATRWLDERLGPWRFDVMSLKQERLAVTALGTPRLGVAWQGNEAFGAGARVCGGAVPEQAPFAAVALSRALLDRLWPADAPPLPAIDGPRLPWLYVSGKPYEGRLFGMALPAATLRLPWGNDDAGVAAWARSGIDRLNQRGKLGSVTLRPRRVDGGPTQWLVDATRANVLGKLADEDSVFLEAADGALTLGSHLGSHLRQRPDTAVTNSVFQRADAAVAAEPAAAAWLWLDLPRTFEETQHAVAIYRLAARLSGASDAAANDELLGQILSVLRAAAELRNVTVAIIPRGPGVEIQVQAGSDVR